MPTIYQAMAAVLGDMPAVGKDQRNQQQGFAYRGIDDVLNHLNPVLAKHRVFCVPHVLERIYDQRATSKGSVMHVVNLHVQYTFYGPEGDSVHASAWGEGTDSGDKATPKAMTSALKYVLFQAFAISCEEMDDGDATTPEETVGPRTDGWASDGERDAAHSRVFAMLRDANAETAAAAKRWREAQGLTFPMTANRLAALEAEVRQP